MGLYSVGIRSAAAASGATYATLHTGASYRARIREISFFLSAATASSIGLIRPSNTPVASTSTLGQAVDPGDPASTINVDSAWSTAPTIGSNYLERYDFPATAGVGGIIVYPPERPLVVAVSSWLVFWNFGGGTGAALDLNVKWEE